MNKTVKNILIAMVVAILVVFVIIYVAYELLKVKPVSKERIEQTNLEGANSGLDTNKLFENVNIANEEEQEKKEDEEKENENKEETPKENTEVLNGTISSKEEKAVELAKRKWGSAEGVYFSNMAINSKGNYIVTVNDSKTSKTLVFYEIDVDNEIVKEK